MEEKKITENPAEYLVKKKKRKKEKYLWRTMNSSLSPFLDSTSINHCYHAPPKKNPRVSTAKLKTQKRSRGISQVSRAQRLKKECKMEYAASRPQCRRSIFLEEGWMSGKLERSLNKVPLIPETFESFNTRVNIDLDFARSVGNSRSRF